MATLEIDFKSLPNVTNEKFYPLYFDPSRWLLLLGGAGSGKSKWAASDVVRRIVTTPGENIVVTRKVARTLRESVYAELDWCVNAWGLGSYFEKNMTTCTFRFRPNGSRIVGMGLDDPEKLKSLSGVTSFWHEEPTELQPEDLNQCNLRLRGHTPGIKRHVLTFNPVSVNHWLKKRFYNMSEAEAAAQGVRRHHSTYKDNRFLDDEYRKELESLKEQDENYYRIYCLGEWGQLSNAVYRMPAFCEAWPDAFDDECLGLDFGYNVASALVHVGMLREELYFTELIYQPGLTNSDLARRLRDVVGDGWGLPIYADAAEPDRIRELQSHGFLVYPAYKGPGSVKAGIDWLRGRKLWTKSDNVNLNSEFENYIFRKDHSGRLLDEPVKANDHGLDAVRYAAFTRWGLGSGQGLRSPFWRKFGRAGVGI